MVIGSIAYLWKCINVTVEFNNEFMEDSDDIPIKWTTSDGTIRTGFADNNSFRIRNTSKLYPPNSTIPRFK